MKEVQPESINGDVWIFDYKQLALTFEEKPQSLKDTTCGFAYYPTEQAYFLNMFGYHMIRPTREKRTINLTIDIVETDQLAIQITEAQINMQDQIHKICIHKEENKIVLLRINPTRIVKKLFRFKYLQARTIGDLIMVWNCIKL